MNAQGLVSARQCREQFRRLFNGGSPVSFSGGSLGWTVASLGDRLFTVGDDFTAEISLCTDMSPRSAGVAWQLPHEFNSGCQAQSGGGLCRSAIGDSGESDERNANQRSQRSLASTIGDFSTPVSWKPDFDVATPFGRPLTSGERLTAAQTLCAAMSVAEFPPAKACDDLPAPRIQHPTVGTHYVIVAESIWRDSSLRRRRQKIGDGSGTVVVLTRAITGTDTLTVVQQVGDCTSETGLYRVSVRNPIPKGDQ